MQINPIHNTSTHWKSADKDHGTDHKSAYWQIHMACYILWVNTVNKKYDNTADGNAKR